MTNNSSDLLLCAEDRTLSVYSLPSGKLRWTNKEFQQKKLHIHPLASSFLLICSSTGDVSQLDTDSLAMKHLGQVPVDYSLHTTTSNNRLYTISNDRTKLVEFDIDRATMVVLPLIQSTASTITRLSSVSKHLIFHADDEQVYLWWNENQPISQLEKASKLISKDHRLVLVGADGQTLILYDLKNKLRGTIPLEKEAGQCDALCLSDNHSDYDQYLFTICHDRFLRIYRVESGQQLTKVFIGKDLQPFIGIVNHHLVLRVAEHLTVLKILEKKSSSKG